NDWLERRASHRQAVGMEGPEEAGSTSAIVIGYGRFGQTVSQMLMAKNVSVTLIDSNPSQIEVSGSFGAKVYYGDGLRLDLLRLAGAENARALLFCIDGADPTRRRVEAILEAFPQAGVFVRAFDRVHLIELTEVDLAGTVREVFESAVLMGREALRAFDIPEEEVARVEQEYRQRDTERLVGQSASGDLHTLKERMFGPDNALDG
ncbi:MAG: sodium:proton exchanger, partial [Alphaproteobacteria bacterium]|nr:sodium:proton exchanger [Alphaproteobacteria bacterium]